MKKVFSFTVVASLFVCSAFAAEQKTVSKPTIAKMCTSCHQAEANSVRGIFDNVAFKSKTIQVKLDDSFQLLTFDEDDIKVVNAEGKSGDGEFLKNNKMKGKSVKIEFTEKDGVKTAVKLIEKVPVKLDAAMIVDGKEMSRLVKLGAKKGNYYLFDSRPAPRFQQGYIPSAINLPYNTFAAMAEKVLPADKNALIIFYCAGPTCQMSPISANLAKKMGYNNVKVYIDGMPGWLKSNYGIINTNFLKEAWMDKDIPQVLLDVRNAKISAKGFIKGAVTFPEKQAAKLIKKLELKKNAPIMVYDQKGAKEAESVAAMLIKAGYENVLVVANGYDGWKKAGYDAAKGKLQSKVVYVPKPRPGELNLDEFKKYIANMPPNVMIIDVRNASELKSGMLKMAKNIPAEELKDHVAEIPKDKLIITHCATGVRAEMAYNALKDLGYTNVKFINAKIEFEKDGSYTITGN